MRWRDFVERCNRWESTTAKLLGMVMVIFAVCLVLPGALALFYGENAVPFLAPILPLFALGLFLYLTCADSRVFRAMNGVLLVAEVWLVMFLICCLPYLLSGMGPVDALFEAVSGLTTTGITMIAQESQDVSLLVWQSMTQWIGGIAVVIIFLYFLPMVGFGRSLFQNELAGSGTSTYTQRTSQAATSFIYIYMVLSLLNFVILLLLGVEPLESVCLTFATISTGGLVVLNSSMAAYSDPVQWVTVLFMILGGTSFYLHYRKLVLRQKKVYSGNSEFKMMMGWFAGISLIMFVLLVCNNSQDLDLGSLYETFKNAVFTTVSLGTTTGYYIDDFTQWPSQCMLLLMMVAMIGASSSSTSGGIKFSRLRLIYGYIKNGFGGVLHSNAVYSVKIDGRSVDNSVVNSAIVVFMMYFLTLIVGAVLFMISGYDMVDSFGLTISAITNGGMGFGNFGPTGSYLDLDLGIECLMMALMWIGRLEIITAVIMFTPGFWKEIWLNSRARRRARRAR